MTELMEKYEKESDDLQPRDCCTTHLLGWYERFSKWLEADNQKLRENASEVFIRELQIRGGFLNLEAETSLGRVYAEYASHILEENKAQNFVTCELKAGNSEQMYYLTIGRCDGKTVQEKYIEVCNEKADLEAQLTWRPASEKPEGDGLYLCRWQKDGYLVMQYKNGIWLVWDYEAEEYVKSVYLPYMYLPIPPAPEGEVTCTN